MTPDAALYQLTWTGVAITGAAVLVLIAGSIWAGNALADWIAGADDPDPDAVLDDVYAVWLAGERVDAVFAELTSPEHWGVEVLPYVMDDWTTDDVVDGDQLGLDARFAAITREAAETWRADA